MGQRWPQEPQSALLDCRSSQSPRPRKPLPAHWANPAEHVHWPLMHVAPTSHATPHALQLAALVLRSTQVETIAPPGPGAGQSVRPPVPQPATHAPLWQVVPSRQTLPHRPQLASSLWVFVHVVRHCVSPGPHWQAPFTQLPPIGHWALQPPQSRLLVVKSTHAPRHSVSGGPPSPVVQLFVHCPTLHTWPAAQAFPHAPQLAGSLAVSVHAPPLHATPPFAHAHAPPWH